MWAPQKRTGFTIVELLIVIVVIAILAAISIVAYNGIQNRARGSAASSALQQSVKKISMWQVDNTTGSPTCTQFFELLKSTTTGAACLFMHSDITYQYKQTNANTGYCITATAGNISYIASTTNPTPIKGGCLGHGQNGVETITNFVLNPGFENNSNANGSNIGSSGGTVSIQTTGSHTGSRFFRQSFTQSNVGWGQFTESVPTGQYTATAWVRSNKAVAYTPYLQGTATRTNNVFSNTATLNPNIWTQINYSFTVTAAGTVQLGGYVSNNATWTASDYLDLDSVMMTAGSGNYTYADGSSPNWDWNGVANAASSTGVPL